jgi:hypothetical protein
VTHIELMMGVVTVLAVLNTALLYAIYRNVRAIAAVTTQRVEE